MSIQHQKSAGFTLVELLVVLGILSILATLLMPALKNARESAKQAVCMNNLRQIGLALNQYAADNEGVVVLMMYHPGFSPPSSGWGNYLYGRYGPSKYLKDLRIAHCPSGPLTNVSSNSLSISWTYGCRSRPSTDENSFVPDETYHANNTVFVNLGNVQNPADYPMLADCVKPAENVQIYIIYNPPSGSNSGIHLRHNGGAMVLFADGHVELCDSARLKTIGFSKGYSKLQNLVTF
ncbi:MAG: prepilin-type N-terminal cleavage/methylation domain-containing protein [Verrucomicrobiae bacterium]|nr:prepilin-type N-terminal cleavage/methylation domain-containing protein [Verrucomicrobiae bacterium]